MWCLMSNLQFLVDHVVALGDCAIGFIAQQSSKVCHEIDVPTIHMAYLMSFLRSEPVS